MAGQSEILDWYFKAISGTVVYKNQSINIRNDATRCSGHYNTSCGNTLVMYGATKAVFGDRDDSHVLYVEGDDVLVGTNFNDLDYVIEGYARYGIDIRGTFIVDHPGKAKFCGLLFDERGRYFDCNRMYRKLLSNFPTGLKRTDYIAASVRSALDNDPTNPILHELHRRYPAANSIINGIYNERKIVRKLDGDAYLVEPYKLGKPSRELYEARSGVVPDLKLDDRLLIEQAIDLLHPQANN